MSESFKTRLKYNKAQLNFAIFIQIKFSIYIY